MKAKRKFWHSTGGALLFCSLVLAAGIFLHCDFWNWGVKRFYFGWIPQELLYRLVLISVLFPLLNYLIARIAWPLPREWRNKER